MADLMGYPMTYPRFIHRNGLTGDYDPAAVGDRSSGLLAGDLRRLERDQRDERHLSRYAALAGVTWEQAARVLDAFFTDFGSAVPEPASALRDETREAFFALHRFIRHGDGCKCATEAHCASDCTCGMYRAMERMRAALVARS